MDGDETTEMGVGHAAVEAFVHTELYSRDPIR